MRASLANLLDVSKTTPSNGQVEGYNSTTGLWTPTSNVPGNAATATALQTARLINGVSFNGTADIVTKYWIRQAGTYTLASQTTAQAMFNAVTNGTITLPTGIYEFGGRVSMSAMSATSGNALFDVLGGGGATLGAFLWDNFAVDNATAQVTAYQGSMMITKATPVAMATAAINTTLQFRFEGSFDCSVTGTVIPSITLKDLATPVVAIGSMMWFRYVGATGAVSSGPWT